MKQWRVRLHNRMRLRSASFRRKLDAILAHYPAQEVKTAEEICADLRHLNRNNCFENISRELEFYLRSGMHLKGADISDYISFLEWMNALMELNSPYEAESEVFEDKQQTKELLAKHGFRVARDLGKLYPSSVSDTLPPLLEAYGEVFCKPLDLYGGKGCMKLRRADGGEGCFANERFRTWSELEEQLTHLLAGSQSKYVLLEESIRQHSAVAAIHPSSINTLRLFSVREADGQFRFLQGIIRFGSGGACVDNATSGGFFAGCDADGILLERAHCWRHEAPVPMFCHPDTGVVFKGYALPYFEEAKQMICAAHEAIAPQMLILAWDVAVTPTGPLIVEINNFGSVSLMQRAHGGWMPVYRRYMLPELEKHRRKVR